MPIEPAERRADRLVREWRAVQRGTPGLSAYTPAIQAAVEESTDRHLVYLVAAEARTKSLMELVQSQQAIREEASLWLLTWQDLHRVLVRETANHAGVREWVSDLAHLPAVTF